MTKFGSPDIVISIDDSGSMARDLTQHITEFAGIDIEALIEESHTFGDTFVEQLFSGVKRLADISVRGFYDDVATVGPDAVFRGGEGDTRAVSVTWGGANITAGDAIIKNYRRLGVRGESQKYEAILSPTGIWTEAP